MSDGNLTDSNTVNIKVKDVDIVAPSVVKVDPARNTVVKVVKSVKVAFSEAIKLGVSAIALKNGSGTLQTTISVSGNVLTVTPKKSLG